MSETLSIEKQSLTTQSVDKPHAGKKFYIETLGCQMNVADSELVVSNS